MKKWTSLCLCLLAVFCLLLITPKASAATSGIYTYKVTNGETAISDCDTSASGDITIPSTLGGYPVTAIDDDAFADCYRLTGITIPNGVTSIGEWAFGCCTSLSRITIPDSVTSIGDEAFYYCESLQDVYYAGTREAWDAIAIGSSNSCLTNATIHFESYGPTLPEATEGIYTYKVTNGKATIKDCRTSVSGAITIPSTLGGYPVATIGNYAFDSCTRLTSITIPNSVTSIGEGAFGGCTSLTSITIPNSVTGICGNPFVYCTSLTGIWIDESNPYFVNDDKGVLFTRDMKTLIAAPGALTEYRIPDTVTTIAESAFCIHPNITTITIPASVTLLEYNAFECCGKLTDVYIEDFEAWCNVKCEGGDSPPLDSPAVTMHFLNKEGAEITVVVFDESLNKIPCFLPKARNVISVKLPSTLTAIGSWAFTGWESLRTIILPDSVTSIGYEAFDECESLQDVYYSGTQEAWEAIAIGGGNSYLTNATIHFESYGPTLPEATEGIYTYKVTNGKATITECSTSASGDITIPSTLGGYPVTAIGDFSFNSCRSLTSVTIPGSVTSIGYSAFGECTSLTSVAIQDGVISIGQHAFGGCDSLTSITIPKSVTHIEEWVFYGCDLNGIWVDPDNSYFSSDAFGVLFNKDKTNLILAPEGLTGTYTIPSGVTSIDYGAFCNCDNLTGVTIPNSVTEIGPYAFFSCESLTSVTIPNGVPSIGDSTFEYCTSLTSITIPDSVTSIGSEAFYACTNLATVKYAGSKEQWDKISGYGKNDLASANVEFGDPSIFAYTVTNGEATITDCDESVSGDITIPDKLGGYPVTAIGDYAFMDCTGMKSIVIPDSVLMLNDDFASKLSECRKVTIGSGVSVISLKTTSTLSFIVILFLYTFFNVIPSSTVFSLLISIESELRTLT